MPIPENGAATLNIESLHARLATDDGQKKLLHLANLIARSAIESIPPELRHSLNSPAGMAAFRAAWPGLVHDFLSWSAAAAVAGAAEANEEPREMDPKSFCTE